jgi:hypothetical protein
LGCDHERPVVEVADVLATNCGENLEITREYDSYYVLFEMKKE